jgi:hypothetical protein
MNATKTQFDELIGKKIVGLSVNADKDLLVFDTEAGKIYASAVGDCCSRSWFNHLSGVETLIGYTVIEIAEHESVETSGAEKTPDTDSEQKYGWTFTTERGLADLDMRNDSNGYYGGEAIVGSKALGQCHDERDVDFLTPVVDDF